MLDIMRDEFRQNLHRVQNLANVYDQIARGGSGRQPVETQDILRAAVVFLHATLEDLLRELLRQRLPEASLDTWREELTDIPLPGKRKGTTFNLHHLAYHRGATVDDVLSQSVDSYLDESNFNNISEIKEALRRLEVDVTLVDPHRAYLGPLMARRHQIVHQLDSNRTQGGSGFHVAKSLSRDTVGRWHDEVCAFGTTLLETLEEENS